MERQNAEIMRRFQGFVQCRLTDWPGWHTIRLEGEQYENTQDSFGYSHLFGRGGVRDLRIDLPAV